MRLVTIIMICFLLTACATQSQAQKQELALGKANFAVKNYDLAYNHLAPLADSGDRDAQYAIGYMYYNGYGVPKDEEQALLWIQKSAEQHNLKAVRALHKINTAKQSAFYTPFAA